MTGRAITTNLTILLFAFLLNGTAVRSSGAQGEEKIFRIGIIGCDTSHVPAFTTLINDSTKKTGCKVVVAFPGGSPDIPSSANRVDNYTHQLREEFGVEIVTNIEELCEKVDGVLLESLDGRCKLEQIKPVFAAKRPVYIDKPMAARLADVLEIFRLARENEVPCWSSSSLRYGAGIVDQEVGQVLGCVAWSPCPLEAHHPDLYWYGVHGVETLFAVMGPGCQTVSRTQTPDYELAVGVWRDGRIGTFRGLRGDGGDFGAIVFGSKAILPTAELKGYGYGPLIDQIIKFFQTGDVPVSPEETIEIFAFMSAADESKHRGGAPVSISQVLEKARQENLLRRSRSKPSEIP